MNKELKNKAEEWYSHSLLLREKLLQYFTKLLKANNNKIEWDTVDLPEFVTVSYDGGNHPEYASNLFSTVKGVELDKDGIILYIEDDPRYGLESVPLNELLDILSFLDTYQKEIGFNSID